MPSSAALARDLRPFQTERLIVDPQIRFSGIISALSCALDITQGHPQGHSMRSALIGMRLSDELSLTRDEQFALFYSLLLKDLGCSSNAAKITYLFGVDDHRFKSSTRLIDWTRTGQCVKHCWSNCAPGTTPVQRVAKIATLLTFKASSVREIAEIRCDRGAQIARMLKLPESVALAIYHLDEHWNGRGNPARLRGEQIPRLARICCLAQTVEVYFRTYGLPAAMEMSQQRRGRWFDPAMVDALLTVRRDQPFWDSLRRDDLAEQLSQWEPQDAILRADEACLDQIAEAFAMVVDAKSPWTFQHSSRVAQIAVGVAQQLDCCEEVQRDIRRAALLHDLGKLGVSNVILDKPGKPTADEFAQIRRHPEYTQRILERVEAFERLADVAAGHHERLDGRGYHLGRQGDEVPWVSRILAVADIFEALTANRPYRAAMQMDQVREILIAEQGKGLDPECVQALLRWHDGASFSQRVDAQLAEVERLVSGL